MSSLYSQGCTGSPFCEDGQVCRCEEYEQHLKEQENAIKNHAHQMNVILENL